MSNKIVLTDRAWPDTVIEEQLANEAGYELIARQIAPGDAAAVDALIAEVDPIAIMTCWAQVSARAIESPSQLKVVARLGIGLDNIAIDAAAARGAWVTNVPDYCIEEVSDHVVAMLLNRWRGIAHFDAEVKAGRWQPSAARLARLSTKTIGIIGYGKIGRLTARKLAEGFGCRVLVNSPSLTKWYAPGAEVHKGIWAATLERIRNESDAIVLHLPLTAASRHLIDDDFLAACPRRPLLVNVSRGGLVDTAALLCAIDAGLIDGAALDVIEGEPNPPRELVQRPNVIVTPHIAFSSDASIRELRERCTQDVIRALRGERPLHPCNAPRV